MQRSITTPKTRLPGLGGSIFVNNAKLHPHSLSANVDGLIDNRWHIIRPAENVYYVDLSRGWKRGRGKTFRRGLYRPWD